MQRCVFDKASLGYDEMKNVKLYQNFFERKKKIDNDKIEKVFVKKKNVNVNCNFCDRHGHISSSCFYKKNVLPKSKVRIKKVWVAKGTTVTNSQGSKFIWVPKS
ncbi:hypothetical protein CFOL_v3_28478 [Cephalotus follicularis]|uniref:CCHC-type domain-containing protein n=1 Tax=Cephalotus follicularis TaxID=3775 RepID=A0A1Q3CY79_CEPFO|nr:hypothetical protein CFOL_v3_28478 [Cephalotus follicularis]